MTRIGFHVLAGACMSLRAVAGLAETGFYVGADIGLVEPDVEASDGFQVYATGVPISVLPEKTRVHGSTTGWSAVAGYRVNRHLAAEAGYVDLGTVDIEETYDLSEFSPPLPPAAVLPSASEVRGPTLSLLGIVPFAQDRFEAFARAGVFFADQTLKGDLGVASGVEMDNSEDLWLLGAGLVLRTTGRWSIRLEYQAIDELRSNAMTGAIRMQRISLGATRLF
ncbi:MAG TPA: outer membrane beta-barrel protein [Steroidobacteraceae bacterium]|nr:outer membrane beta-barrel protein [Steroidobacteraceae bacterium]